ncbi:MAG: hypothetical protein FWE11_05950 [Defluviitaleaceae bacterium]|nr:hypothetical protein [Defluviitaleaceae bacterium]
MIAKSEGIAIVKIHVVKVLGKSVYGYTSYGAINVDWDGTIPEIEKKYDIELDIDEPLIWGANIVSSITPNNTITIKDNMILISGILETVHHDGYSVLRIGESIITFLAQGNSLICGSNITIIAKSMRAFPVSY